MRVKWNGERRGYRLKDKYKICDALRTVIQDEGQNYNQIHEITGVASATVRNWLDGPTRQPQNACVMAVTNILGWRRNDRVEPDGSITPAFAKVRRGALDYQAEREAQADYWV